MRIRLLVGREYEPADGVRDFSEHLTQALRERGHDVEVISLRWDKEGWLLGMRRLLKRIRRDRPDWVLVQHTHLMWSRWAFGLGALLVVAIARLQSRVGVVIHDPNPFPGERFRSRIRRAVQLAVMRCLAWASRRVVVTVPPDRVIWLGAVPPSRVSFIPVGTNILPENQAVHVVSDDDRPFTVAIFGMTEARNKEVRLVAEVAQGVVSTTRRLRVVLMGRGSDRAYLELSGLIGADPRLELVPLGIVPSGTISAWLAESDVLLFSRDEVSSRRGTAMAAVAHGLPVVGFEGAETGYPITDAGVALTRPGNVDGLVNDILRIASDLGHAGQLRLKSRLAYERHFSWNRIAMSYEDALA